MSSVPLFIGMDYADGVVQLCAIDAAGKVHLNRACDNDWQALARAVKDKGMVQRAAIEACSGAALGTCSLRDRAVVTDVSDNPHGQAATVAELG